MLTLTAVNLILENSGSMSVKGPLDPTDTTSQASKALRYLTREELRIQSKGWAYNTRRDVELTPDTVNAQIVTPPGVISIDSDSQDRWRKITQLGELLYDLDNNTQAFTGTLRVQYVLRYDFECIPEEIAQWIACEAALSYYQTMPQRDIVRLRGLIADRDRAMAQAKAFNARVEDANILTTPAALALKGNPQNTSLAQWLQWNQ